MAFHIHQHLYEFSILWAWKLPKVCFQPLFPRRDSPLDLEFIALSPTAEIIVDSPSGKKVLQQLRSTFLLKCCKPVLPEGVSIMARKTTWSSWPTASRLDVQFCWRIWVVSWYAISSERIRAPPKLCPSYCKHSGLACRHGHTMLISALLAEAPCRMLSNRR